MPGKKEYIRINPADSVAVALQPLAKGTDIILKIFRRDINLHCIR